MKFIAPLVAVILPLSAAELEEPGEVPRDLNPVDVIRYIDATSIRGVFSPGLELEGPARGEFDYFQSNLFSFISKPVEFRRDLFWAPMFRYQFTNFEYSGPGLGPGPGGLPLERIFDRPLHEIALPSALLYSPGSRWYHGLFVEPGINTDFEQVDSRDLFLSVAAASAYQVNDCFVIGAGVFGANLTNDPFFVGGPGFVWTPTEDWLITYFGPRFIARREFGDDTRIGFEASWNGGEWSIEQAGEDYDLDISSIRTGLYWRQRLFGQFWGEVAVGYTFANSVTLSTPGGLELNRNVLGDLGSAPYISLAFSVNRW